MPNRYHIRRRWIDEAGGFWSWTVTLNGGVRPVCVARTYDRAADYVKRKLKRQAEQWRCALRVGLHPTSRSRHNEQY